MTDALFLSSDELADLATPADYVEHVREGYRQRGEGAAAEPRTKLTNADPPGMFTGYLAVLPETGVMGGYTYGAGFGAGDAWFVTPLFDAESGEPLAVLDGASMNPSRPAPRAPSGSTSSPARTRGRRGSSAAAPRPAASCGRPPPYATSIACGCSRRPARTARRSPRR